MNCKFDNDDSNHLSALKAVNEMEIVFRIKDSEFAIRRSKNWPMHENL
jgi:hypothetical protein